MEYAVLLAAKIFKEEGLCVPVQVMVIYSAGIGNPPLDSYPGESHLGDISLQFKIFQILLEKQIDLPKLVDNIEKKIAKWDPIEGAFLLPPEQLAELYLAPLGRTPKLPSDASEKYLELGRVLSEKSGDPHILGTMLCAVKTRGNIVSDRVENKYLEVLKNMGIDTAEIADFITEGKFSKYREKSETLAAENATLAAENTAKDAEIKALAAGKEAFETIAVLAMHSENKSAEEISAKLKLSLPDVRRIMEDTIKKI
jgi:hypothetical protein